MKISVKIYSCYKETYSRILEDVVHRIYPNVKFANVSVVVEDLSNNGTRNIQSQRSLPDFVTRTVNIYEDGVLKHIVGVSNTNFDYDKQAEKEQDPTKKYIFGVHAYHANTYLKQGTAGLFNYYFTEKANNPNIELSFYLLDLDQSYPHNLFNILSYRELHTIGFKILNIDQVDFAEYRRVGCNITDITNIAYPSFNKYMNDIAIISSRNKGNIPSYLKCEEHLVVDENNKQSFYTDKYVYTFKSLSAQGYDTLFRAWCMKVLADKEGTAIEFRLGRQFFAYDQDEQKIADRLTGPIEQAFGNAGINLEYVSSDEFMLEKNMEEDAYLRAKKQNEPRNQQLFRNNIRKKGVPTWCVVCGNDNPRILEAAHIWDVSSIRNATEETIDNFLTVNDLSDLIDSESKHKNELFFKKYCLTNSGDNGVWLCSNHHGLFDSSYFCFDGANGKIILRFAKPEDVNKFVQELVNGEETCIPDEVLTRATKAFLCQRNLALL